MRILFIDDYPCSIQNGIGTFREVFTSFISAYTELKVTIISLNSEVNEVYEIKRSKWNEILIPRYNEGNWRGGGTQIADSLRLKINDEFDNIFILNYSPCGEFITQLKKIYPLSKWIFIVHDQGWCSPLLGDKKILLKIIGELTPPFVSEQTAAFVKDYYYKEIEIYNLVDKVVCLSDSMKQILSHIYNLSEDKIEKIENGISSHQRFEHSLSKMRIRTKLGIPKAAHVIIYVGRPVRSKGLDALLLAVRKLRRKYPDLRCVIVGNIYKIINRWNVYKACASNIIMPGFMTKSELREWYAAADIGVMLSYSEQCSFAALEMMDAGLLVVSSNGIGLRDMFLDRKNSFVARIGNVLKVKNYAKRICIEIDAALSSSPSMRKRYTSYNQKLLDTKYSAETMASKYVKLFRSLIQME